jgi:hypothetical protein
MKLAATSRSWAGCHSSASSEGRQGRAVAGRDSDPQSLTTSMRVINSFDDYSFCGPLFYPAADAVPGAMP